MLSVTNYSTPPQPAPPPLGGRPEDRAEPGKDPVWWTRLVTNEKWWNQVWFRWVLAVVIMSVLVLILELSG